MSERCLTIKQERNDDWVLRFIKALKLVWRVGADEILRLEEESVTDSLTGLLNRRGFLRRLGEEKTRSDRYGHRFQLAYLDLDNLKIVNDTLGHHEGDRVLKKFAQKIQGIIRSVDFAGRLGGDEFAIVFIETQVSAEAILHRLYTEVTDVSIGHYHYDGSEPISTDEMIHLAESEMREDKKRRKAGRD